MLVIISTEEGPQLVMPWRDAIALLAKLSRPGDYTLTLAGDRYAAE